MDDKTQTAAIRSQPAYRNAVVASRLMLLFPVAVGVITVVVSELDPARAPDNWLVPVGGSIVLMSLVQMFNWLATLAKIRSKLGLPPEASPTADLTLYLTDVLRFRRRDA